jgi:hypothetical protein
MIHIGFVYVVMGCSLGKKQCELRKCFSRKLSYKSTLFFALRMGFERGIGLEAALDE